MQNKPLVKDYFSTDTFLNEQAKLFIHSPQYIAHQLMCPTHNDYRSIEWLNHAKILVNNNNKWFLIDNICKHRQAIMKQGYGNSEYIVCDLHKWTYNKQGALIGAPLFDKIPQCANLQVDELVGWQGLLFKKNRDVLNDLSNLNEFTKWINFDNYLYSNTIITDYDFNWKTFIEVYAEDYHVDPFHPGLGNFVDCSKLKWSLGDWYHLQILPMKTLSSKLAISKRYKQWYEKVLAIHDGVLPEFGAIWMVYYPNIMIECYPKCIVISVVEPIAPEKCRVVTEFYYPDEIVGFDDEYVELQQAVYMETSKEDDEICYRMHNGRRQLYLQGQEEYGPYQESTELGLKHFHDFYVRLTQN